MSLRTGGTCRVAANRSGVAYVTVLLLVLLMGTLGLAFVFRVNAVAKVAASRDDATQAQYLAESAVHHALWRLLNDPGFVAPDPGTYTMHSFAGGRYGYKVRRHTLTTFATVATVGVFGQQVARQSRVFCIEVRSRMLTGSYNGNGVAARAITGLGFRPDLVIVKSLDPQKAVIRTSTMSGDVSKVMTGDVAPQTGLITSLDADGFTVGSADEVNRSAKTYHWAAFKAFTGQMTLGTYVGDDTTDRVITVGGNFQPELIFLIPGNNKEVTHRSGFSDLTFDFDNQAGMNNVLTTPVPFGGIRLGSDDRANKLGVTYHYVCWPSLAGVQKFSGHIGNGLDNRSITGMGFQPEFMILRAVSEGRNTIWRPASLGAGDSTLFFDAASPATDRIQALLPDGYQVGKHDNANKNGVYYACLSWAQR